MIGIVVVAGLAPSAAGVLPDHDDVDLTSSAANAG